MKKSMRAGEHIMAPTHSPTAPAAVSHAQHTSVPWRVVDRPSRGLQIEWGGSEDGEERPVAHMRWTDGMRPEVEARVAADAAFIVRACNHHEALLAALKALHDDIADYARINNLGGFDNHCMRQARAAIANAEGN